MDTDTLSSPGASFVVIEGTWQCGWGLPGCTLRQPNIYSAIKPEGVSGLFSKLYLRAGMFYMSYYKPLTSYHLTFSKWIYPLAEVNWLCVAHPEAQGLLALAARGLALADAEPQ